MTARHLSKIYFFATLLFVSFTGYGQTGNAPAAQLFGEGIISTGNYETHPAFSPSGDTLYFVKCSSDLTISAICVSYKRNGKWSSPEIASFSGKYFDTDPFVSKDGHTLYFISSRPIHPGDSSRDWDIWKTELTRRGWSAPEHLPDPVNSWYNEYYPTLADNGTLYFGSKREGGHGNADIYKCVPENGVYKKVENLGAVINTGNNEYEPFIAPDESYLVFMATIPNTLINADLYISRNVNGQWSTPVKFPAPVNSDKIEWGAKVSRDNQYLFFGSTRTIQRNALYQKDMKGFDSLLNQAGNGFSDIYYVSFPGILKMLPEHK